MKKNKLVKQFNFMEQRQEKFAHALSDKDMLQLQQRIDATASRLADMNDKMADIKEGASAPASTHWVSHTSKELLEAGRG